MGHTDPVRLTPPLSTQRDEHRCVYIGFYTNARACELCAWHKCHYHSANSTWSAHTWFSFFCTTSIGPQGGVTGPGHFFTVRKKKQKRQNNNKLLETQTLQFIKNTYCSCMIFCKFQFTLILFPSDDSSFGKRNGKGIPNSLLNDTMYGMCVYLCGSTLWMKGLPSPMAFPVWASNRKTTGEEKEYTGSAEFHSDWSEYNMSIIRCLKGLHVKSQLALQFCPTFGVFGLLTAGGLAC